MKILVPMKQVVDPDQTRSLRVSADGGQLDSSAIERIVNPFDDYALEAALRLTENVTAPKVRLGQVTVVSIGEPSTELVLRSALAIGADDAIRIDASDDTIDAALVAKALSLLVRQCSTDLVLLGKQTVDGDGNEVAQRLAALLDWPQVTCATSIHELSSEELCVRRDVDGGVQALAVRLPAVISVDLRIIAPDAVRSRHSPADHVCTDGVRFASLPAIITAKRKPIAVSPIAALLPVTPVILRYVAFTPPPIRKPLKLCDNVSTLVDALKLEAQVL